MIHITERPFGKAYSSSARLCVLDSGAFVLMAGEEPTYRVIEEGGWPSEKPYLTMHRMGSLTGEHGVGDRGASHGAGPQGRHPRGQQARSAFA